MNSALSFLGIAAGIALIGGVVVSLLHRNPSPAAGDGVEGFRQFMDALAPEDAVEPDADGTDSDDGVT